MHLYFFNIIWFIKTLFCMCYFASFSPSFVVLAKNYGIFNKIFHLNFPRVWNFTSNETCICEYVTCALFAKSTNIAGHRECFAIEEIKLCFLFPEYVTLCTLYCLLNNVRYIHLRNAHDLDVHYRIVFS